MDERRHADEVDPVTLEVVRNKLNGIANEMQLTLLHSAFSPIVKEGMDCSAALFTADGQTIAQATAIPIHLATMIPALAAVIDKYPVAAMEPGDVYILNDPYSGGTHLPDITLFHATVRRLHGLLHIASRSLSIGTGSLRVPVITHRPFFTRLQRPRVSRRKSGWLPSGSVR
jgi:N-methylhydantoinase B